MTEWTSPPQTALPLTTSVEKAPVEDRADDTEEVIRVAHTSDEGQKGPARRGRPRKTPVRPMPAGLNDSTLGISASVASDKSRNPAGKKVGSRTQTPNLAPGPSSKVAPSKPKNGAARKTKR